MMAEKAHILMLAPVHRPWGNRVVRESTALAAAGYRVTALMRCSRLEAASGVTFMPAPDYRNRFQRFLTLPRILRIAVAARADVYHLHNPDMIPIAFCLKVLGKRVIYDTHEDFSQRLKLRQWIPGFLRTPLGFILAQSERLLSHVADATLVTQEGLLKRFSQRTHLLRNAPETSHALMHRVAQEADSIEREPDEYRLIYAGGLSRARGLFDMLDALLELNERGMSSRLWLFGSELEPCLEEARRHAGWAYVDFLGLQPHETVLSHMKRADVGLAILADEGDHASARPTKLFEYLACGLPFVASDFPLWRDFVGDNCGRWVNPSDQAKIVEALADVLSDNAARKCMSEQGDRFIQHFNWDNEMKVLLDIYAHLLDKAR